MRFQAAIFDIDGVLVDSPHEQAWRESLARLAAGPWAGSTAGYAPERFTSAVYQAYVSGKPREAGAQAALNYFGIADPDGRRVRVYCDTKQAQLLDLIERGAFTAFDDGIRLLLRLKAAGMRIVAASSSKNADLFLRRVPLDRFAAEFPVVPGATLLELFDANVNGQAVASGKPDPAIFLLAAAAVGVAPPACVVIEDAPAGVQAAKAGGMACIGVARRDDRAELRAAGADWVVRSLDELPPGALR